MHFFQISITSSFKHTLENIVWKLSFFSFLWVQSDQYQHPSESIKFQGWTQSLSRAQILYTWDMFCARICMAGWQISAVCLVGLSWVQPMKMAGGKSECRKTLWVPYPDLVNAQGSHWASVRISFSWLTVAPFSRASCLAEWKVT